MDVKKYLSQTRWLDKMISVKLERVDYLRSLAEKASAVLSKTPPGGSRNPNRMEDIIVQMVDMETEVRSEIASLLSLQKNITAAINSMPDHDYKMVLELRYLSRAPWNVICSTMKYSKTQVLQLHHDALSAIEIPAETVA